MAIVRGRRDSLAEAEEHSQKKLHTEEQESCAAAKMFQCVCSSISEISPRVRRFELNFTSDRGKFFLDSLGKNARNQGAVSVESREISASYRVKWTASSSKDEFNRTRMFIKVVDCPEMLNDDDLKKKVENFLGANVFLCKVSREVQTKKEWPLEEWSGCLASCAGKFKETGTVTESETKSSFDHSTPAVEKRVSELEKELEKKEARIKNVVEVYAKMLRQKERDNVYLTRKLETIQRELQETQEELGRVNFENDMLLNEKKRNFTFSQIFNLNTEEPTSSTDSGQSSCSSSNEGWVTPEEGSPEEDSPEEDSPEEDSPEEDSPEEDLPVTDEEPTVEDGASCSNVNASSVQESREESRDRDGVSLTNIPTTAVERSIYNNYKLLLLAISRLLLASEVSLFKQWARSEFSIEIASDISEIFKAMDRKRIITAVNLDQLKGFFEKIVRFDLVYLIECFLQGDYAYLRNSGVTRFFNIGNKNSNSIWNVNNNCTNNQNSNRNDRDVTVISPSPADGARLPTERTISHGVSKNGPAHTLKCSSGLPDGFNRWPSFAGNCGGESSQRTFVSPAAGGLVVTDGTGMIKSSNDNQREAVRGAIQSDSNSSGDSGGRRGYSGSKGGNRGIRVDSGSNGQKLSKFERPPTMGNRRPSRQEPGDDLGDNEEWLCNHYKRRCLVKFDCCNKYWPCHRCHNNQTKCGQTKLKSRDTKFVKCVTCGKEQQFGANGEYCIQCNAKFSNYFCAICKHLTGKDDHPYHCEKCGICRIHGDRSFHCDVCGVCLDVQLRGNHKCRAGSAHDECCICLEDAFTGCQILPCSHKVHKECATQMIRSGITRCPICRESFAHKLERRTQPPKKPTGKQ